MISAIHDSSRSFIRGLNRWCASELRAADHKSVFKKAALLQVLDDGCIWPV